MSLLEKIKILTVSSNPHFWAEALEQTKLPLITQNANQTDVFRFMLNEWSPDISLCDASTIDPKNLRQILNDSRPKGATVVLLPNENIKKHKSYFQAGADHVFSCTQAQWVLRDVILNLKTKWLSTDVSVIQNKIHNPTHEPEFFSWNNFKVYPNDYIVKFEEQLINTSPVQFRLLLSLITNHDQLLTRQWLQQFVWQGVDISPRSIDAQISKLKKLIPEIDNHIINIYGKGYILSSSKKLVA